MDRVTNVAYQAGLRRARRKCERDFGDDIEKWKTRVPLWCKTPANWANLCDQWGTDEWKQFSKKNRENRCRSDRLVTHHTGSASAYKHHRRLSAKLKREATFEELYLEIHVPKAKKKGKKKTVSDGIEAERGEDADGQVGNESEICEDPDASNTPSPLNITDPKARLVYEKVKHLELDPANADKPKDLLWLMASGGPSHSRKFGFGSKLDGTKMAVADLRYRATPSVVTSVSLMTHQENHRMYTSAEVARMMEETAAENARKQAEVQQQFAEICERRDYQERERNEYNNSLFSQLFARIGEQMPEAWFSQDHLLLLLKQVSTLDNLLLLKQTPQAWFSQDQLQLKQLSTLDHLLLLKQTTQASVWTIDFFQIQTTTKTS